jgi:hypothetical protein
MKRLYPLLFISVLIYWGCEEPKEEVVVDTIPPTVTITFPQNNSSVFEIVSITCISSDNEGVEKVELWVNGVTTGLTDNSEPYSFDWNTTLVDNGNYTITIRSYDTSDNTTDSEPIVLTIDNTQSNPQPVNITSITYTLTEMTIIWNQSTESDFDHYELLVSETLSGEKSLLVEVTEQTDNTYVLTEFDPTQSRWYWINVFDVYGYSTLSSSYYILDDNPTPVILDSVSFYNGSFTTTWSQNNDNDFSNYKLYEISEDSSNQTLVYETNNVTDISYVITGITEVVLKYFQVVVEDVWGLESESNIEFSVGYPGITLGGSDNDYGKSGQQTNDGGYIITGYTNSYGNGMEDIWTVKIDSDGQEEWNQTYGGSSREYGESIQQTTDGGYIITGFGYSVENRGDVWLIKTDSQGSEVWKEVYGYSGHDFGYSVQQTIDGGYIVCGTTHSWDSNGNGQLLKFDSNGSFEWSGTGVGSESDRFLSVQQTTDGGYIVTGSTGSCDNCSSYHNLWLMKFDNSGTEEWNKNFGGNDTDSGNSVQQTTDGGYIITGWTGSLGNGSFDVWLLKTDSDGNEEWNQTFGGSSEDRGYSVQQTTDSGYIITGLTPSFGNGGNDVWLIKTDSNGNEEWNQTFGGSDGDGGESVQQTDDGGYIITGYTSSFGNGSSDVWLIKTDSEGNTVPIGD